MARRRAVINMQPDLKITLTDLSVADINLLIAGLGKLPLEIAADLWLRVKAQGEAQMAQQTQPSKGT